LIEIKTCKISHDIGTAGIDTYCHGHDARRVSMPSEAPCANKATVMDADGSLPLHARYGNLSISAQPDRTLDLPRARAGH